MFCFAERSYQKYRLFLKVALLISSPCFAIVAFVGLNSFESQVYSTAGMASSVVSASYYGGGIVMHAVVIHSNAG